MRAGVPVGRVLVAPDQAERYLKKLEVGEKYWKSWWPNQPHVSLDELSEDEKAALKVLRLVQFTMSKIKGVHGISDSDIEVLKKGYQQRYGLSWEEAEFESWQAKRAAGAKQRAEELKKKENATKMEDKATKTARSFCAH